MPDKLHRCVEDVKGQGKTEKSAWAICNASLSKSSGKVSTKKSIEYRGSTFPGYNKPTKSNRDGKKKMVLAKKGDKTKVIHYGDTHYKNNYSVEAKRSFRARHKCDQQKDKLTAAYWACKDLWPTGPIKKSINSMDVYKAKKMSDNPCWEGYEMVGHKMKGGKKVPNCVPTSKKSAARKSFSLISGISNFSALPQVEKREFRISIPVPPSVASKIFMHDGIPMEDLSVDLAYIPPDAEMPLVRLIVSEFAKSIQSPLQLQTNGYGRLLGDGEDTLYVSVDSPDLSFERERLIAVLSGNGIDVSSMHGFDPKIVIKTLYPEEPMPQFNEQGIVSWVANRIEICNGPYKYGYSTIFDTNQGVL